MKFRMFTDAVKCSKIAVNVDKVAMIEVADKGNKTTEIWMCQVDDGVSALVIEVSEDFDTVFSRLNTIAE